jgi:uncharacterized MAPEG superfamily protein
MTANHSDHQEQDQQQLADRLRELEAEVNTAAPPQTTAVGNSVSKSSGLKNLWAIAKFVVLFVLTIAVIRTVVWLGSLLIFLVIAWVLYQVFFSSDRS